MRSVNTQSSSTENTEVRARSIPRSEAMNTNHVSATSLTLVDDGEQPPGRLRDILKTSNAFKKAPKTDPERWLRPRAVRFPQRHAFTVSKQEAPAGPQQRNSAMFDCQF